jgi:hypothetical protein
MEKETATEWLFKQLWEEPKDKLTWNTILIKAKEMEKEQIIQFANDYLDDDADLTAEQYYKETYKLKQDER